jgi:predicted 2-oxoglutarate/Fe(II)-dependent dioxygenase YbiX
MASDSDVPKKAASILDPSFEGSLVVKEGLDLKAIGEEDKLAFLLHGVLSEEECNSLIELTEREGYVQALVNVGSNDHEVVAPDVRQGKRVILDDPEFVAILWKRISHLLPRKFNAHQVVGPNERLRFLRYDPGDYFRPHEDGSYFRPDGTEASFITLQMYLNQGFKGGETTFFSTDYYECPEKARRLAIVPRTGSILVFEHWLLHEGSLLNEGRKYSLRTDVMFSLFSGCRSE